MADKVGFDPGPLAGWLAVNAPGEQLAAFTRVMTPSGVGGDVGGVDGSVDDLAGMDATLRALGLSRDQQIPVLIGSVGLLVVTPTTFRVLRVGGLKPRIKNETFAAPLDAVTFRYVDDDRSRYTWRHWVIGLPDGRFIAEPQSLGRPGKPTKIVAASDHFVATLGPRAERIGQSP